MDYSLVWMRRDYWESLCHHWATGPWQERSQVVKRNRVAHPEKNIHTSGSVSHVSHSQKLETFDRTMADRCVEGTLARLGSRGLDQRSGRAEEGLSV
ncbi:hypothetical protein Taro_038060 [Colocasia esculenta]|uniref:Uncharacterized protein n=1 Tax=Colocasia esculenta TaxID=4460 RepID=A0A843W5P4_COLES|nr:hypothetical protein [Colocasia esculenta]